MNRTIKFRAWDGMRMSFNGLMLNNSTGIIEAPCNDIIMQFTGLLDKNGRDIYESDIIQIADEEDRSKGVIVLSRGCYGREFKNDNGVTVFIYLDNPENWEIIGNVFEDLLDEQ